MPPLWNYLPNLILCKIFKYLSRNDRISASKVCLDWESALDCPNIWYNVTVNFDEDQHEHNLVREIVTKYGYHMKRLILTWSQKENQVRTICTRSQVEAAIELLTFFVHIHIQVEELSVIDWFVNHKCIRGNRLRLIFAVADFIRSQKCLHSLSLEKASFRVNEVIRILSAVAYSKCNQLNKLNLKSSFHDCEAVHLTPRYLEALSRLSSLRELRLDYPALSDGVLFILAENTGGCLEKLHIDASGTDYSLPLLTDGAWRNLTRMCPKLRVAFYITYITHYEEIGVFLLPNVPLYNFTYSTGYTWDQTRSRDFRGILSILIAYYSDTLEIINLNMKDNREIVDDLLVSLVEKCSKLTFLQFSGVLRNVKTIRELCETQSQYSKFKTFHVRPKFLNEYNYSQANLLCSIYKEPMLKMCDVDFKIEDPTVDANFF